MYVYLLRELLRRFSPKHTSIYKKDDDIPTALIFHFDKIDVIPAVPIYYFPSLCVGGTKRSGATKFIFLEFIQFRTGRMVEENFTKC